MIPIEGRIKEREVTELIKMEGAERKISKKILEEKTLSKINLGRFILVVLLDLFRKNRYYTSFNASEIFYQ